MLGSVSDAEDVVQEAFIRWMRTDRALVLEPEAFLRRTVTRLCLDQLKSARHRRETYVGPWLPEPLVENEEEEDEDVALPLMMTLEHLSPLERAAFLLHDVFGLAFEEVATTIDRDLAACRQLAARGRTHVRAGRPRYAVEQRGREIAQAFFVASRSGDMTALGAMLASDVSLQSDGAASAPRRSQRCSASRRSCVCTRAKRAVPQVRLAFGEHDHDQRLARLRHPRSRRRTPDDGAGDRRWKDRRDLHRAQSGKAAASTLSGECNVDPPPATRMLHFASQLRSLVQVNWSPHPSRRVGHLESRPA
jgi:DNA-directed RNA polymerase specialized sigma24 family protein